MNKERWIFLGRETLGVWDYLVWRRAGAMFGQTSRWVVPVHEFRAQTLGRFDVVGAAA